MNIVHSGFIYGGAVITLDYYDEQNGHIILNSSKSKILRVYADHFFGPSKAKPFSVTLVEEEEKRFWFPKVLQWFLLNTRTNEKMSSEFSFVRYFDVSASFDNFERVFNCLCFWWATGDECDRTVAPDLQTDDNIDIEEWYGVIPFSSIRSGHHNVKLNYCVSPFSCQLPWPLYGSTLKDSINIDNIDSFWMRLSISARKRKNKFV